VIRNPEKREQQVPAHPATRNLGKPDRAGQAGTEAEAMKKSTSNTAIPAIVSNSGVLDRSRLPPGRSRSLCWAGEAVTIDTGQSTGGFHQTSRIPNRGRQGGEAWNEDL
jgi:hypothetical protein